MALTTSTRAGRSRSRAVGAIRGIRWPRISALFLLLAFWMAVGLPAHALNWFPTPEAHASGDLAAPGGGAVDSSSGAATLSIPIAVPQGPGGLAPQLALVYSSQAGDGPFGIGWRLPLGEIRCSARFGVPDYANCAQYELNGQLLVEDPATPGRYHTQVESFQRIEKIVNGWMVTLTDGALLLYGNSINSRVRTSEPDGPVARWLLRAIMDRDGNSIVITYARGDTGTAYPELITYANDFRNVKFLYEERPDQLHDFEGGIEREVTQRLREIQVTSGSGGEVFQRRIFRYAATGDYTTVRSRLDWTQLFGTNCPTTQALDHTTPALAPLGPDLCTPLPAQTYDYTDIDPALTSIWAEDLAWYLPEPLVFIPEWGQDQNVADTGTRFADVNGDGRIDVVRAYCTRPNWPCANGEGDRVVYLNTPNGWDADSVEAQKWTARLKSLNYEQPSVHVQSHWNGSAFRTCGFSSVETVTRGVVFSEYDYYFFPVEHPVPQPALTYRPLLSWQIVDLDGDGLPDLVTSEAFGGIARRHEDCLGNHTGGDFLPVPNGGGEVRAAFRNTGDPDVGWVRDDSLAAGLPLFSSILIDDRDGSTLADCRENPPSYGNAYGYGGYEYGDYGDAPPCMTRLRFHPVFLELDGDGKPELVALDPEDKTKPWMHEGEDGPFAPGSEPGAYEDPNNPYTSRAWDYREKLGEPGVWEWQSAAEFDFASGLTHIYTAFGAWDPYGWEGGGQWDTDSGVRFADLNRDGLMDVISSDGAALNRGAGDPAVPGSAWSSGSRYAPPVPMTIGAGYIGENIYQCFPDPDFVSTWNAIWQCGYQPSAATVELTRAHIKEVVDLNGDGWVDLYTRDPDTTCWDNQDRVWLNSGAALGGDVWVEDTSGRFLPPRLYYEDGSDECEWEAKASVSIDANGDGVVDLLYADRQTGVWGSYMSQSSIPDLIEAHDNGRGGTLEFEHASAVARRDADLERAADDHALAVGEDGVGSPHWKKIPVVTSVTVSGLNRTDEISTYAYADPRWDATLRTGLGFRLVEHTRPDGSVAETYFYQALGRTGRVSEQTTWDAGGPLSHSTQDWEIASGPSCPGCPVIVGSIGDVYVGRVTEATSRNEYGAAVGADSGPDRTRTFTYDDTYGYNFVGAIVDTTPNHEAFATFRAPWDDPQALAEGIIGLVAEARVEDISGGYVHARSVMDYWPSGRLMSRTQDAGPRGAEPATSTVTTHWFYDANGNVSQVQDPKGRNTYFCYDGDTQFADGATACPQFSGQTSHSVRVGLLDALGHVISFEPELASGRIVRQLADDYADVPGTYAVLDAFGRATEEGVIDASSVESVVSTTEHRDFGELGVLAEPYVETLRYVDAAGSDWIRTATYGDGFGGAWRTVKEVREDSVVSYRGSATYVDSSTRRRRETYAQVCTNEHCSTLVGDLEDPAVVTTTDALGRVLEIDTPDGFAVSHYFKATQGGLDYDGVRIKNPKGDLKQHLGHQGKVVWVDECHTPTSPGTTDISGVSCGSADQSWYLYEPTGELWNVFDAMATSAGDYTNPAHYLRYEYDRLGRITKIYDPDGGVSESAYDVTGKLISHLNARGQEVTYQYNDLLDRPTGITTPVGEADITFDYTEGFLQRTGVTSSFLKIFRYDDLGRLETQQLTMMGIRTFLLDFQYDLLGRQTEITYPGTETVVRYEYDGAYLERVCELNGKADCLKNGITPYISDVVYDALGRRTEVHTDAGVRSFSYEATNYRLAQDRFDADGPGGYWMEKVYTQYDELGNIKVITGDSSTGDIELSAEYTYDARNRLKTWSRSGGVSEAYDYDALGNLTLKGDQVNTYNYADVPHAIRSRSAGGETINYTYDADGNVASISDGPQYYRYDSRGRMTCVGSSAGNCDQLAVTYDEQGQRIFELTSVQTHFVGDLFRWRTGVTVNGFSDIFAFGEHIATKHESKVTLRQPASTPFALFGPMGPPLLAILLLGGGLCLAWWDAELGIPQMIVRHPSTATLSLALVALLMVPQGALAMGGAGDENVIWRRIVVTNHLGSGVLYLNHLGTRLASAEYDPFGGVDQVAQAGTTYDVRFAGHRRESTTDFYYMKARWYDPEAGRFASVDPVVGNKNDPQSHNPYSYVENNPVNFTDPTGMCRVACISYGVRDTITWYGHSRGARVDPVTGQVPRPAVDTGSASSGSRGTWNGMEEMTITARRGSGAYTFSSSTRYRSVSATTGTGQRYAGQAGRGSQAITVGQAGANVVDALKSGNLDIGLDERTIEGGFDAIQFESVNDIEDGVAAISYEVREGSSGEVFRNVIVGVDREGAVTPGEIYQSIGHELGHLVPGVRALSPVAPPGFPRSKSPQERAAERIGIRVRSHFGY